MLKTHSTHFVSKRSEIANSLFNKGGTANGHYKKLKGRIHFYNLQGELFAALIMNSYGERFFVSASVRNGKAFYMYGLGEKARVTLGLNDSYMQQMELAENIANNI